MKHLIKSLLACVLIAGSTLSAGADEGLAILQAELERLAEGLNGVTGLGVRHLESGDEVFLNRDERFPMASTYKIPIAVQVLTRVDNGEISLEDLYTLQESDFLLTHSAIAEHLLPGSKLTIDNLLSMMLRYSDNIATDIMLRTAGGSAAVTGRMQELGLEIQVDRPTWSLILNFAGQETPGEDEIPEPEDYAATLMSLVERFDDGDLSNEFYRDVRDTSTPAAMTRLLQMIWDEEILSATSSQRLVEILYGTTTGIGRLKGALPPGTQVAHKTGTIGTVANDVGIVDLPHGAGHVVVAAFTKLSVLPTLEQREAVIAQLTGAVYDYFLFEYAAP